MGSTTSDPGRADDETAHHVVVSHGFCSKSTEVTRQEWKDLMGTDPSYVLSCGVSCPVVQVNWWDSIAYCNALSTKELLSQCYSLTGCTGTPGEAGYICQGVTFVGLSCTGYRLPTEAEWEYAARAGSTTSTYNGIVDLLHLACEEPNSALDSIAWFKANSCKTAPTSACVGGTECGIHAVKGKLANSWGLYDMLGNVDEWVWDRYAGYPTGTVTDPTGPATGASRVIRGGAWASGAANVRAASRVAVDPTIVNLSTGLRPARSLP